MSTPTPARAQEKVVTGRCSMVPIVSRAKYATNLAPGRPPRLVPDQEWMVVNRSRSEQPQYYLWSLLEVENSRRR